MAQPKVGDLLWSHGKCVEVSEGHAWIKIENSRIRADANGVMLGLPMDDWTEFPDELKDVITR